MPIATRQFLVHCLRAHLATEGMPSVPLPAEPVDWNALVSLAEFHRVAPLLDRGLREGVCDRHFEVTVTCRLCAPNWRPPCAPVRAAAC
jgi:hypothetical protein